MVDVLLEFVAYAVEKGGCCGDREGMWWCYVLEGVDVEVKNAVGWKLEVGGLSIGLAATSPWGVCKT